MQPKPRVALVGPWKGTVGGVTTFMTNVVQSPLSASYEFLPFDTARPAKRNVTDNYGYAAIWKGGLRRLVVGAVVTLAHMLAFPFWIFLRGPHIVQVQSSDFQTFWESAFYVRICRIMRVPVAERLGGAFDNFYAVSSPRAQAFIRRILKWPDRLIVQSDYWRDLVASLGRSDAVFVVPNWVSDELVAPVTRPHCATPVCLFSAGNEARRKGLDEVIAAAAILKGNGANIRFRIVAASEAVERRVSEAGIGECVELEGYLGRGDMVEAMRSADIFLLPSHAEGFPNALVEAMATGIAAIVTSVGAIPEIVAEGAALVVPVGDGKALARAILQLAEDGELRAQIGARAVSAVNSRYTESIVLPTLERVWHSSSDLR
jgi:glycosyltransferase involved in cell wall biosynthesis